MTALYKLNGKDIEGNTEKIPWDDLVPVFMLGFISGLAFAVLVVIFGFPWSEI